MHLSIIILSPPQQVLRRGVEVHDGGLEVCDGRVDGGLGVAGAGVVVEYRDQAVDLALCLTFLRC